MENLEAPREALAAAMLRFNELVRAHLAPHHENLVKSAVGAVTHATAEYTKAFVAAEHHCKGRVTVPRYLTEAMFQALKSESDPVKAWQALLAIVESENAP